MAIDQPIVVYTKDDKEKHATKAEMDELTEAWEKKHKTSRVGKHISLNDYFNDNLSNIKG